MHDELSAARTQTNPLVKIRRALISVSNKEGVAELGRILHGFGAEILSTGGTARILKEAGLPVVMVEDWTGFPECFGGRLKTLSPAIYGGLLYRRDNPSHIADANRLGMSGIDLVVCNLYPFDKYAGTDAPVDELVENIDIGGPCMIRAAAKNHDSVAVLVDPADYRQLFQELTLNEGATSIEFRRKVAAHAFSLTAAYDAMIAREFQSRFMARVDSQSLDLDAIDLGGKSALRYGENPHQRAFVTRGKGNGNHGVANSEPIQGKDLSWNNLLDGDAAWRLVSDMANFAITEALFPGRSSSSVAIIKHGNPCGAATCPDVARSLHAAWAQDPVSAFGSVIALSAPVTKDAAAFLADKFVEVILAPDFEPEAFRILAGRKNLRLMQLPLLDDSPEWQVRSISGGYLLQEEDKGLDQQWVDICERKFPDGKRALGKFGALLAKHLKSNAIALVAQTDDGFELAGAGMGQPNRIDSLTRLALPRALGNLERLNLAAADLVLASDAFFPFPDTVEASSAAGIKFIVQPGGSIRDGEVVSACDRLGVAMAFTGRRHFRH